MPTLAEPPAAAPRPDRRAPALADSPPIEHKAFPAPSVKAEGDEGIIEAIVNVFNVLDSGNDIVRPGFFTESLGRKLPKGVWGHDWTAPIARTLEARELSPGDPLLPEDIRGFGGLYIRGQFNLDTQRGREAYSDIKFGIIDEFSIGYRTIESKFNEDTQTRELIKGDLFEWSPVLVGMNDRTRLLSVKSTLIRPSTSRRGPGRDFSEHSRVVVSAVGEFVRRALERREHRTKEGRELSAANLSMLDSVAESLEGHATQIRDLTGRVRARATEGAALSADQGSRDQKTDVPPTDPEPQSALPSDLQPSSDTTPEPAATQPEPSTPSLSGAWRREQLRTFRLRQQHRRARGA